MGKDIYMNLQPHYTERLKNATLFAWLLAILTGAILFRWVLAVLVFILTKLYGMFIQHH